MLIFVNKIYKRVVIKVIIVSFNMLNYFDIGCVVGEVGLEYFVIVVLNCEISDVISVIVISW